MPLPPTFVVLPNSNSSAWYSGATPGPESTKRSTSSLAFLVAVTRIVPPSGCASIALRKRLSKHCRKHFEYVGWFPFHRDGRGIVAELPHQSIDLPDAGVQCADRFLLLTVRTVVRLGRTTEKLKMNRQCVQRRSDFVS